MRLLLGAVLAGVLAMPAVAAGAGPGSDAPIALLNTEPRKAYELWIVNGDGSNAGLLVRGFGVFPVGWFPGGRRLLFQQERKYWIADVHTGTRVPQSWAAPLAAPVAISPDGTRAAVLDDSGGLSVSRLDGTAETRLVPAVGVVGNWSPDGTRILYVRNSEVHTIGADGTDDRLIAAGGFSNASWSPDGTRIVASGAPPPPPPGTPVTGPIVYRRLVLLAAYGTSQSPIPNTDNGDGGAWAPDGSQIAFGRDRKTWVIAPDGSGLRPLTAPGLPNAGAWSSGPRLARAVRRLPALPTVQVSWTSGQVKVKPSGTAGSRILRFPEYHGAGTHVDARKGRARLSRVRDNGTIADTFARGGVLEIGRVTRRRLDVRLIGAGRCGGSLRTDAELPLRVRGRRSATTGRDAAWTVTDRCDGSTLTTVQRGHVDVHDLGRNRTKTLRAGAIYTAR